MSECFFWMAHELIPLGTECFFWMDAGWKTATTPTTVLSTCKASRARLRVHAHLRERDSFSHLRTRDLCEARSSRMIRPDLMHFGLSKISPSVGLRSMLRGVSLAEARSTRLASAWDALRGDVMTIAVLQRV